MLSTRNSNLLDCLRTIAALFVVIAHASTILFQGQYNAFAINNIHFGHLGVIIFFVLSGFVISYVTDVKHGNFVKYLLSRTTRLYVVLLPVIIITYLIDSIGINFDANVYSPFGNYDFITSSGKVILTSLFLHESGFISFRLFSNSPLWSLAYEFWYYIIFGGLFYLRGFKRIVFLLITSFIAGSKILILFPVWLLGFFLYKVLVKVKSNKYKAPIWALILSILVFILCVYFFTGRIHLTELFLSDVMSDNLSYSKHFIDDYVVGLSFMLMLLCCLSQNINNKDKESKNYIVSSLVKMSKFSFSLYALHAPLLYFYAAIGLTTDSFILLFLQIVSIICICWIFYLLFEQHHIKLRNKVLSFFIRSDKYPQ